MRMVNSLEELKKVMMNQYIRLAQDRMTETFRRKLREFIWEKYYKTYEPEYYDRSGDLLASAMVIKAKIVGDTVISEIYMNPERLKETTFNYTWNGEVKQGIRHAWHDKQDIIEYTAFGGTFGSGLRAPDTSADNGDYDYWFPKDEDNNVRESYWKEFAEYVFGGAGREEMIKELKKVGLTVI